MDQAGEIFGEFFSRSPVPFFVKDRDGRFVYLNTAAELLTTEGKGYALGSHYSDHMDAASADAIAAVDQAILDTGEAQVRRQTFVVQGEMRYALAATFPIRDDSGEIAHFGVVILEITDAVKTEQRFRALSEQHPIAMFIARLSDDRVLLANPALFDLLGLEQDDPRVIENFELCVDRDEAEHIRAAIERGEDEVAHEVEMRRASGETFWAATRWQRIDYDGEPAVVIAITDISDKKEAEAKLKDSEARLTAFLDHAPAAMYLKDADDRYVVVNDFIAQVFKRNPDEVIGMTPTQLLDERAAKEAAEVDAIIRETGKPHVREAAFDTPAGVRNSVSIRFPVFDEGGDIRYIGGVILDTTDLKQAEAAMRESETRLNAFLQNAPMTMYMKDEEGRFLIMNEEGARHLSVPRDEFIGKKMEDFSPEVWALGAPFEKQVRESGKPVTVQQEYQLEQGRAVGLNTRFPVPDAEGNLTRIGGVFMDVTKQVLAEEELSQSREALHQSEKMTALGSLLAGVSHELNNPLAIVVGEALMLEEEAQGTDMADAAGRIMRAAERCSRIVQTFLAMARQKEPERAETDLNKLVNDAIELANYGLRSDGVELILNLDENVPSLMTDPDQITQVLLNLIMNATQALQEQSGTRKLSISSKVIGERVQLDVRDNGPGVADDVARRIFEPFFTTKPAGAGTGIGLSFSHGIAEAHGGSLSLQPSGEGACFRLELPIEAHEETSPELAPTPTPSAASRILVVDDEEELAGTLKRMLERDGKQVDVAVGGEAAIERLEAQDYDIILSDLRMPDVDGPALYQWICEHKPEMKDRVAVVTGDILGPAATRFLSEVDLPVLEKPFTRSSLRALIETFS